MSLREGLGAHRVFRECVHTVCLCLLLCVCVCLSASVSVRRGSRVLAGNDRVLERASLWMIRRQASQSKRRPSLLSDIMFFRI